MNAADLLTDVRLMPVVTINDPEQAVPLAQALLAGGANAIEVTLRTKSALAAMQLISDQVPNILLGAGSVRSPNQFAEIRAAGCSFAVSPGSTATLLDAASLPYLPGAATASESLHLLEHGYTLQKFFPAEYSGGVNAIKAISQPLPDVRFCPTGGINASTAPGYMALESVVCVGGSWFIPADKLEDSDFAAIEESTRLAIELINLCMQKSS